MSLAQTLETKDSIRFADSAAVTLSFYARATANTVKSKSIKASIGYNTTADTKMNTFVGTTTFTTSFGTAATDWTFCTLTVGIPSTAKTVGAYFLQDPAGGLAVGDGFEITGVQLERQAVATAFQRNSGTTQAELAACQRYYYRTTPGIAAGLLASGNAITTTDARFALKVPVTMRVIPTAIETSSMATINFADGANPEIAPTGIVLIGSTSSQDLVQVYATAASGLTAFRPYYLKANASTTAFIGLTAEL
jgi:hypothetical protein